MLLRNRSYNINTIDRIIEKAINAGWNAGGMLKDKEKPTEEMLEIIIEHFKTTSNFYFDKDFCKAYWGTRHFFKDQGNAKFCPKCKISFYGGSDKNTDNECLYWARKMERMVLEDDRIKFLSKYL